MSFPICDQKSREIFRCKGNWILMEHYVIPSNPVKKNERYGYCSMCWENGFKDNTGNTNPENLTKHKSFKDSNINPNSGPCGCDTL